MLSALVSLLLASSPAPDLEKLKTFIDLPPQNIELSYSEKGASLILNEEFLRRVEQDAEALKAEQALAYCVMVDPYADASAVAERGLRDKSATKPQQLRLLLFLGKQEEASKLLNEIDVTTAEGALAKLAWIRSKALGSPPSTEDLDSIPQLLRQLRAAIESGKSGEYASEYLRINSMLLTFGRQLSPESDPDQIVELLWRRALAQKDIETLATVLVQGHILAKIKKSPSADNTARKRVSELNLLMEGVAESQSSAIGYLNGIISFALREGDQFIAAFRKSANYLETHKVTSDALLFSIFAGLGAALLDSGQYEESAATLEKARTLEDSPELKMLLAKIYFRMNRHDETLRLIEQSDPSDNGKFLLEVTKKAIAAKGIGSPEQARTLAEETFTYVQKNSNTYSPRYILNAWLITSVLIAMTGDSESSVKLIDMVLEKAPTWTEGIKLREYLKST